jgi:hypothetical protein
LRKRLRALSHIFGRQAVLNCHFHQFLPEFTIKDDKIYPLYFLGDSSMNSKVYVHKSQENRKNNQLVKWIFTFPKRKYDKESHPGTIP